MIKSKTRRVVKLDLIAKTINQIIDESRKPMSIIEIQNKFNLKFPFSVKRVQDSTGLGLFPGVTNIRGIKNETCLGANGEGSPENYIITENDKGSEEYEQRADIPDYILYEEN